MASWSFFALLSGTHTSVNFFFLLILFSFIFVLANKLLPDPHFRCLKSAVLSYSSTLLCIHPSFTNWCRLPFFPFTLAHFQLLPLCTSFFPPLTLAFIISVSFTLFMFYPSYFLISQSPFLLVTPPVLPFTRPSFSLMLSTLLFTPRQLPPARLTSSHQSPAPDAAATLSSPAII